MSAGSVYPPLRSSAKGSTVAGFLTSSAIDANTQALDVHVVATGIISTANSSSANLGAAAAFTGTSEDISSYSQVNVSVFSSHASATDGLQLQQSIDGTNWDFIDAFTIPAATGKVFSAGVQAKFFRVVYTNGGTLTTSLRLQTLFNDRTKKGSSVRPQDTRTNDNDFEEMLGYGMVFNNTTWDRMRGNANGVFNQGSIANNVADAGNPLKVGGVARTANPTANTALTRVDAFFDDVGRQITVLNQVRDLVGVQATTVTVNTETTIVTAGGAGVFNDLTSLTITNSSATAVAVTLRDSTAGTTRAIYAIAANGGITIPFSTPMPQATANANWTLQSSASVSSLYVSAVFAKNV